MSSQGQDSGQGQNPCDGTQGADATCAEDVESQTGGVTVQNRLGQLGEQCAVSMLGRRRSSGLGWHGDSKTLRSGHVLGGDSCPRVQSGGANVRGGWCLETPGQEELDASGDLEVRAGRLGVYLRVNENVPQLVVVMVVRLYEHTKHH